MVSWINFCPRMLARTEGKVSSVNASSAAPTSGVVRHAVANSMTADS